MSSYVPSVNFLLNPLFNSCAPGKHGSMIVEGKDVSLRSLNGNIAERDSKSTASMVEGHGSCKHADLIAGRLPKEPSTIKQGVNNQDLAKGEVPNHDNRLARVKTQMSDSHTHEQNPTAGHGNLAAFKQPLSAYHGKPNVATIESHKDKVLALAVCGDLLYTTSTSKDIRAFRAPLFEQIDCFGSGSGAVHALVAFGEYLYSAHQDNKIRVWQRLKKGSRCKHKLVTVLPRLDHCVKSMLSQRNYVQVRRHKRKLWIEHADSVSALALGANRRYEAASNAWWPPSILYSASWDKTVKVWSLSNFNCIESFCAHDDAINAMIVIDGNILATASADGTIKLWTKMSYPTRKQKHGLINTLQGHKAPVNALAISADYKVLYSGGSDGTLIAWKKMYSKPQSRGNLIGSLSGALSGEVFIKHSGSGKLISKASSIAKQGSLSLSTAVRRDSSGEVSIGSGGSGEITIIRASSLSSLKKLLNQYNRSSALSFTSVNFLMKKTLNGHTRAVLSVSTVSNNVVCSSSADKTIRVWGKAPEKRWEYSCIAVLAGHGGPVKSIASVSQCVESVSPSSTTLHSQERQNAAADHATLVEGDEQRVIIYSGSLDSKVKVWALTIPIPGYP